MKKISFFLFLTLMVWNASRAQYTPNTGNDAFGYRFVNSNNTADPAVYEWIDISQTGTRLTGLGDDNIIGPIPLGIDFKYYWNTYNQCYVGSNGYIMFGSNVLIAQGSGGIPNISNSTPAGIGNFIGGLIADLTFVSHSSGQPLPSAKVLYQTIGTKFVITYDSVPFWNNAPAAGPEEASGRNTFQIILDAATNNIQLNYKESEGPWFTGSTGVLSMGMRNIAGNLFMRWGRKQTANTPLPPANFAVTVRYPASSTYTFKDVQVRGVFTDDNKGDVAFTNIAKEIRGYVQNAGTIAVSTPTTVRCIITDYNDVSLYNQSVTLPTIGQGETQLITFPQPLLPADTAGQYKVEFRATTQGDQFSGNNLKTTKLVVLDSTVGTFDMRFTNPSPGTVTDSRQAPGAGMVFDPPYQPMVISKISADLVWPDIDGWASVNQPNVADSLTPTRIEVYIGDGPNGAIGSLIDSFTISSETDYDATVVGEELTTAGVTLNKIIRFRRTLPTPFSWFNGARIYVGAIHNNKTRFVWNSPYAEVYKPGFPASGRSLEITGGVYGENRGKDSLDVGVGLVGDPLAVAVRPIVRENEITLEQNVPNPAVSSTRIAYSLPGEGPVRISVRDALGREILSRDLQGKKGRQTTDLNLSELKPSLYFYTVSHGKGSATRRLVVK